VNLHVSVLLDMNGLLLEMVLDIALVKLVSVIHSQAFQLGMYAMFVL